MQDRKKIMISTDRIEEQYQFSDLISQINTNKKMELNRDLYAYSATYGCQQNIADTQKIMGMLTEMGYILTEDKEIADIIVINTCAVREHAEERVLGIIGEYKHLKDKNENLVIAMCGCMIQQEHIVERIRKSYRHIDLLFGTKNSWKFPELLHKTMVKNTRVYDISGEDSIAEGISVVRESDIKAFISIMYGCNNFCTYCIVPYVRGRERSRLPEDILKEFKELVENGYKDITLLGQNVNSYGKDLENSIDFSDLLEMLSKIDGKFKIRFMTSHPKDATHKLIDTMSKYENIAKQLHLPFQAGDNEILKAMNRGYTSEKYLDLVEYAKSKIEDLVLTSDVIVGFPNENEEQFENTIKVIEKVKFNALFTFIYSKRSGTPAAEIEDKTKEEDKKARFARLLEIQNNIALDHNLDSIGKIYEVLVEERWKENHDKFVARTEGGRLVIVNGASDAHIGNYVKIKILEANMRSMTGEIVV